MLPKDYTEKEMEDNLQAAGCDKRTINKIIDCSRNDLCGSEIKLLLKHRSRLLDEIHKKEKQIANLDYLIFRIQKGDK